MAVMAKWRTKTWEVSPKKVTALSGLSTSSKIKAETNTDLENSPATNERGKELVPLSFETQLHSAAGVDVRAEYESWVELVGKTGPFYLAGKKFGPTMQLQEVTLTDVQLDDLGRMRTAKLSFNFEEYNPATTTVPATSNSALNVGAKTASKSELKPANSQLANSPSTGLKVGAMAKPVGEKYATGQKIPQWVKDKPHAVSKISGAKALLGGSGGINSWVYTDELTLT